MKNFFFYQNAKANCINKYAIQKTILFIFCKNEFRKKFDSRAKTAEIAWKQSVSLNESIFVKSLSWRKNDPSMQKKPQAKCSRFFCIFCIKLCQYYVKNPKKSLNFSSLRDFESVFNTAGGARTHTSFRTTDFESVSSANSDTAANCPSA